MRSATHEWQRRDAAPWGAVVRIRETREGVPKAARRGVYLSGVDWVRSCERRALMGQYRRSKVSKGSAEHEVRVRYRRRSVAIGVSLTLAIPLSAAALAGSADASTTAILHVATTGKDTNPCTAKEPCATITH